MAEKSLKILEDRLNSLEQAIGPTDEKIIDGISTFNAAIQELALGRDRVNMVFKRGFVEIQEIDINAQREYVLLMEGNVAETAGKLEQIQGLATLLNSDKIRDFRKHSAKLEKIGIKQLDQLKVSAELADEVADLVDRYNGLVNELSSYFVRVDDLLTNLEEAKMRKEADS